MQNQFKNEIFNLLYWSYKIIHRYLPNFICRENWIIEEYAQIRNMQTSLIHNTFFLLLVESFKRYDDYLCESMN